ncbi:uncharacterized protein LOC125659834 isoform X2 [Ostrea edulis]|uniref:uncharacterized protein LOC125659834 isoform X2 n=1 Tax=Ostrea edulis TaxID=37623 RepID=UPI0024AFE8CF|nr:uncharacterized protein LOC125659834 isoform X2 [Ostrea edulis]
MSSKPLTPGQQNFTRLEKVCMDLIKFVLKDILRSQIKPEDLYNAISSAPELTNGSQKLTPEEQPLCYVPAPDVPDYNRFDVTLLYKLLRNLCPYVEPTLGWGKTPSQTAIHIGDDIERFRVFRNEVYAHATSLNVTGTEFAFRWKDIETPIKRAQAWIHSKGFSVNYEEELTKIKDLELDSEDLEKNKLPLIKITENEDIQDEQEEIDNSCLIVYGPDSGYSSRHPSNHGPSDDLFEVDSGYYSRNPSQRSIMDVHGTDSGYSSHIPSCEMPSTATNLDEGWDTGLPTNLDEGWDTGLPTNLDEGWDTGLRKRLPPFPNIDKMHDKKDTELYGVRCLRGVSIPCRLVTPTVSPISEDISRTKMDKERHKRLITIRKEVILHSFKDWLQLQYKDVRIVQTYIGTQVHSEDSMPSEEDVIVVVIDDVKVIQHDTFRDSGKTCRIVCKLWRYPSSEGVVVSNHDNERGIPEKMQLKLEQCLKGNADTLLKKHSNLEIISVSAFRSKKNGEELVPGPCIVLYCSCKGVVPYSEEEFPEEIDGIKTDVREGFFYLFPNDHFFKRSTDLLNPLMVGANIGRQGQNKEGTLGGFVTLNNGDIGTITCSHLFFDVNSNSAPVTAFDVVQPSYGYKCTDEICGRHEKSVSPSDTAQGVTVDASLIRLTDRVPQRGLFADLKANDLAELGFTLEKLPEYSKGATRDYRKEQKNRMNSCIKCGTGSGLTRGLLRLNGLAGRCRDTTFSLTNPPSQSQSTYLSQLEIVGTPQKAFAAAGDSGALVFQVDPPATEDGDDQLVCIGMVVGGTSYYTTVVTPIEPVLEALNVKMHVFPQVDMDES